MEADLDLSGCNPALIVSKNNSQIVIRCEQVTHVPSGPQRTGKYIHLGMTAADAMLLLAQLKEAQRRQVLPDPPGQPTMTDVPPEKDRH
jgi:hypothetical protein